MRGAILVMVLVLGGCNGCGGRSAADAGEPDAPSSDGGGDAGLDAATDAAVPVPQPQTASGVLVWTTPETSEERDVSAATLVSCRWLPTTPRSAFVNVRGSDWRIEAEVRIPWTDDRTRTDVAWLSVELPQLAGPERAAESFLSSFEFYSTAANGIINIDAVARFEVSGITVLAEFVVEGCYEAR